MLAQWEPIHVAKELSALCKSLLDNSKGCPSKIRASSFIIRLLEPGLVIVHEVGASSVVWVLKMVIIHIIRVDNLPCQGNPLVEVLKQITLVNEVTKGVT